MLCHPFSHKGHLVAKPNHLINYDFLNFGLILKFHIINDFGILCDRIEKVIESSEMTLQIEKLTKAIWSFNLQKEKLCKWKEFELGAVSPTSLIGQSCNFFWPLDDEWYIGLVVDYNDHTHKHLITYEDSEEEWIILARERVKLKVSAAQRL